MPAPVLAARLSPDGDEARRWAEEELSRAKYSEPAPSLIDRVGQWVIDRLSQINIDFGAGASFTGSVTIIILIVIIAAIAILYGRLRPGGRARLGVPGMILDDDRTESTLVRDARQAYSRGDYAAACVDYYRACIRIFDSRGLIIAAPGMTALEAARHGIATTGLPLEPGAQIFDSVMYGGGSAEADDAQMLDDLVERCRTAGRVRV